MTITITLNGATATTSISVSLLNGSATYALKSSEGVQVAGSCTFNALLITADALNFGVSPGTTFYGSLVLNVIPSGTNPPVILVDKLDVDMATVTYPTEDGPVTQVLTPGTPVALAGFVTD
jgi:hypothetical protein